MGHDDFTGIYALVNRALIPGARVVVVIEDFVLMSPDGHGIVVDAGHLASVVSVFCKIGMVLAAHAHGCTFLGVSVMENR
ncbi:hypothetical protein D9M70_649660 [compost metagenome]